MIFLDSVLQMPLMKLPVRSTCVQLRSATILLSPGTKLTEEQLKTLPEVSDIVGPSLFHSEGVAKAAKVFPEARRWGVAGAKEKKPNIAWTDILEKANWPYQGELALVPILGIPRINEAVFIHLASKTLIVTDLCFNMRDAKGIGAWIILHLFDTYRQFAMSRFFLKYMQDQKAFERSLAQIFTFDFDNIVVAHGSSVFGGGRALFLEAIKKRGLKPG